MKDNKAWLVVAGIIVCIMGVFFTGTHSAINLTPIETLIVGLIIVLLSNIPLGRKTDKVVKD